jgi:hypothetical protein
MTADYIDPGRWFYLDDVGSPEYLAAVAIGPDGEQRLILAHHDSIGDPDVCYDPTCSAVRHEQLGPLPIETVRKITISVRSHRCGRPTQAGHPCRILVSRPGDTCTWHRTPTNERNHA